MKNLFILILSGLLLTGITACSKDKSCTTDNTGRVIIENTNSKYSLHFFKNSSKTTGIGDLIVEPKSKGSITLAAGNYNTTILLFTGSCNDSGQCIQSWSTLDANKELDLSACEDLNLVY